MAITLNDEKLTGLILASMSNIIPEGFLLCDGSAINRTTYSSLFALSPSTTSTITMTIASPCVVTWNSHGLATGQSIQFTTTGALPIFSTIQTVYFIRIIDTNTFHLYATLSNAMNTGATTGIINTSGTQSGIHTALVYYWGNGDGSSTFNIPDAQGTFLRGAGTSNFGVADQTVALGSRLNDQFQDWQAGGVDGNTFYGIVQNAGQVNDGLATTASFIRSVFNSGYQGQARRITALSNGTDGTPRKGDETRVKSIAVNYFIKF
jgi:microcystin-dependent protein